MLTYKSFSLGFSLNRSPVVLIVLLLAALFSQACSSLGELAVGDQAPDFSLPASDGTRVALSDYQGIRPVLLFFHMAVG